LKKELLLVMFLVFDYEKLKFKCGLEIHQQLNTNKLFCSCKTLINNEYDFSFERKLMPVVGESGRIDESALNEFKKRKKMKYFGNYETSCLVDMDSEPPHEINHEALIIAIQMALLLKMKLVDEIQVMRKTIIDGSITTGFQRTALIATNGYIETSIGRVPIESLVLEEDSCRKIKETEKEIHWALDRQGTPLIELMTAPVLKTPQHALETALKLRELSRKLKIKRGIGTIRQDVNVSIKNGARIEIKGFQNVKQMPKVIDKEIQRQLKEKKLVPQVRVVLNDNTTKYLRPLSSSSRMYPETDALPIKITKELIEEARRILPRIIDVKKELLKLGLKEEIANQIERTGQYEKFKHLNARIKNPKLVSTYLLINKKASTELLEKVLINLQKKKITKQNAKQIIKQNINLSDLKKFIAETISEDDIRKTINKILESKKELLNDERAFKMLMGLVMKEFKGKADGSLVSKILKEEIKKKLKSVIRKF